jgi:AcrR family transcriptional regulator
MGTAERRERQCQQLREKILNAARELFAAFGYEAVTMRKVAEKIEYSPTTIYLYFHDKDALVRELCAVDFLGLASRFRALQAERDPIRRLKKIGAAYLQFARERPNHYRMMFMTPHPPLAVEERGIEKGNFEEDAWAFLKSTVAEAQRAGMHGIAALHIAKSNDPWIDWRPVDELADRMIESLLRGCGYADSPTPRRTVRRSRHSSAGKRSPKGNQRTTRTKR